MRKRRSLLKHREHRAVLTDTLPFEIPPTFSNERFFKFLIKHSVEFKGDVLRWKDDGESLLIAMRLLFGICKSIPPTKTMESITTKCRKTGKTKTQKISYLSVKQSSLSMITIPFNFRIAHKLDGRTLSIVHPRNQAWIANFYATYSALITYYTSLSSFSIRHPVSVAREVYLDDRLLKLEFKKSSQRRFVKGTPEEAGDSYFVYKKHNNVHAFFESYLYRKCEKKYDVMLQVDINKCFDSIYTHSLAWAVLGKAQTKAHLNKVRSSFGGKFDEAMMLLNHNETSGIVIGPEFSRIFAEIILQSLDVKLELALYKNKRLRHKKDYEAFSLFRRLFHFLQRSLHKADNN